MKRLKITAIPLILAIALALAWFIISASARLFPGSESIITASTLTKAIDIAELSTSQFSYNGIAEIYEDDTREDVLCYIRYSSKVKAGVNMKDVRFDIDNEQKTVKAILPELKITANTVEEESLSFIPDDIELELGLILSACREDAAREAAECEELLDSAGKNLRSVIEALLYPLLESQGYTLLWA